MSICYCFRRSDSHSSVYSFVLFFSQFSDVVVFPLNPAAVRSYCRSFAVSNAHSDASDAARIAEYVHLHHAELRARVAASPAMRRLQALVEHRRSLVDERTGLLNRTLALLKLYYPQAIALLSVDRWRPMDCEFLLRWPSLQALQSARPATLRAFWHQHGSRSLRMEAARLAIIAAARPLTIEPETIEPMVMRLTTLVLQMRLLGECIVTAEKEIARVATAFEDYVFFRALPGAGSTFAPRLLAAFGEDRSRWTDAASLLAYSGIAPVTRQSGKARSVVRRIHCPNFLRQTFHEWACESWKHSRWARAFYAYHKQRGKTFHTIMRMLAFKWNRILMRAWHNHTPYDESQYTQALILRGSPICAYLGE